jgi:hypothetical protein
MINTRTKKLLLALLPLIVIAISGCATYQQASKIDAEVGRIEQKLDAMLEKPKPVTKEEAAAIATKFAGLREITSVRQPRVISSHTQTFNVMGNDGKGDILIGIDPATGEVIKMVKQCPYPGRDAENVVISEKEAIRKSQGFLSKYGLQPISEGFVIEKPKLKMTWNKKHWEIVWRHYVGEVEVMSDFISFMVNAENGEIASYSKVRHDIRVSYQPKLSADTAIALARGILGKSTLEHYDPALEVLKTTLKILYPNNYFENFVYEWSDHQALAWIVQFGEDKEPAIDVWIDALSGELLGGEIYERPVPELWGIPDQTSDIISYPGWEPALDLMQYNTNHTFLGDANEADIVNSIANGDYFVLQTHGGTTVTSEYARIRHSGTTDAQRLTPDEIPNNNLRYALMSFCYSGRDGTGQDFKDVLVDRGADVFQGYVESMNPDHYERALLRYLAEGQYLNNAHWNADADVNPWFTIVFDYDAICYNRIKLAPLLVDVSAPSTAWRNATITTTVRNTEKARFTTATNVVAELQLPSGFTIISGANPQTAPALNWNHNWTAQWTVHAPWLTFGTRTFDVVVWSDNLGVEVDDFDNPYHKVDIHFGFFAVAVIEYLELVKWWELAVIRYEQFTEPRQIMSISENLERYKDEDDVQENPGPFLGNMTRMAELEFEFGNHFREPGRVVPSQYMEAVEAKMAYLTQLQREGFDDINEALTKISAMQMKINAAALKAF